MISAEDRERLRALARAATPGPWSAGTIDREWVVAVGPPGSREVIAYALHESRAQEQADMAYLAALDPATVLGLIDALDAERGLAEHARKAGEVDACLRMKAIEERDAARAAIQSARALCEVNRDTREKALALATEAATELAAAEAERDSLRLQHRALTQSHRALLDIVEASKGSGAELIDAYGRAYFAAYSALVAPNVPMADARAAEAARDAARSALSVALAERETLRAEVERLRAAIRRGFDWVRDQGCDGEDGGCSFDAPAPEHNETCAGHLEWRLRYDEDGHEIAVGP